MTAAGPSSPSNLSDPAAPAPDHGPSHPWETCVWPLAAFLALGALEPAPSGGGLASPLRVRVEVVLPRGGSGSDEARIPCLLRLVAAAAAAAVMASLASKRQSSLPVAAAKQ